MWGNLMQIFVPLFFSFLFEVKGGREGNVVNYFLETLACIVGHIIWDSYFNLLIRAFRMMDSKEENRNILVWIICFIIDKFHFIDGMSSIVEPEKCDHQT
jgi:U3 small nucleolar RNA-associated protein 20